MLTHPVRESRQKGPRDPDELDERGGESSSTLGSCGRRGMAYSGCRRRRGERTFCSVQASKCNRWEYAKDLLVLRLQDKANLCLRLFFEIHQLGSGFGAGFKSSALFCEMGGARGCFSLCSEGGARDSSLMPMRRPHRVHSNNSVCVKPCGLFCSRQEDDARPLRFGRRNVCVCVVD